MTLAVVERTTRMANDLDTEIAEKWEEAVELAREIEDLLEHQA